MLHQAARFAVLGAVIAVLGCLVGAVSAPAAEIGYCQKAPKEGKVFKGRFLDKNCTIEASPAEQEMGGTANKYNFASAAGETITEKSKVTTLSSAAGTITCGKSTGHGELTGPKTGTMVATYTGCSLSVTKGRCTSEGEPTGSILATSVVSVIGHGETGFGGLEPGSGEAWEEFQSSTGPSGYQAVFACEPGIVFRVSGSASGPLTPVGKGTKKLVNDFGPEKGEQDLVTEFSTDGGKTFENAGPCAISNTNTVKADNNKVTVKAI